MTSLPLADPDGVYIRSKNAGPFWMTIDVIFANDGDFRVAVESSLTSASTMASIYGVEVDTVMIFPMPQLRAIKISMPRPVTQGALADRDAHAGQQFVPLLGILMQSEGDMD